MNIWIIVGVAWCIREVYFHYLTHRLLNKIMSRDFAEYSWVKSSGTIKETPKVKVDDGLNEDLSILNDIRDGY
jgi:hypothetical protein